MSCALCQHMYASVRVVPFPGLDHVHVLAYAYACPFACVGGCAACITFATRDKRLTSRQCMCILCRPKWSIPSSL